MDKEDDIIRELKALNGKLEDLLNGLEKVIEDVHDIKRILVDMNLRQKEEPKKKHFWSGWFG